MPSFSIDVVEYHSTAGAVINVNPFVFNDRQLVVAMVRSILTVNAPRPARNYMAGIVRPTLRFMLDWGRVPALSVDPAFRRSLRDFSVTMRVGELAQGVSYAFWKWSAGYTLISDFQGWALRFPTYVAGGKEPDFAMFNPLTGAITLMEAKGTSSNDHRPQMTKAIAQCRHGLTLVPAGRGWGSVLTLDSKTPAGQGMLHIRDPGDEIKPPLEDRFRLFRRSYASWFDLTGDTARSANLRGDGIRYRKRPSQAGATLSVPEFEPSAPKPRKLDPLASETASALGFDPASTVFRLDPQIEAALDDINAFEKLDWKKLHARAVADRDNVIVFPDGTAIAQN